MRARPFWFLERAQARRGSQFTFNAVAHPPLVFVASPDEAREVFRAPAEVLAPGEGGQAIMPIVGRESFMLADGEAHREGRGRLAGLFTAQATRQHTAMVREIAEREIATWPIDTPLELHPRLRALTLRVILRTLLGRQLDDEPGLPDRLLSMLSISEGTALTLAAARQVPSIRGRWRRFLRERSDIDQTMRRLIEARREQPEPVNDALGLLVSARDPDGVPLSTSYIRDSLMSMILAGHETTSAQLAWALQLIAHDNRVQHELASTIRLGTDGPYLRATVQEVLRHRPVFLFAIPRAVKSPIRIGEWLHTPPTRLLVCLYLLHHDPHQFTDSQRFWPERFLDEPPGAGWLPWGGGRKRCPGRRLALLELETILHATLNRFAVTPTTPRLERPRWRSVILAPHAGCRVTLQPRPR